MRIVIALGGNALLRRGEALSAENQRRNVRLAAQAIAPLAQDHDLVITHGNGPQVGLLALQGAAYQEGEAYPLDILDAETEGMVGYLIEQELIGRLPSGRQCATLLTQIEVDPEDFGFNHPSKPIGPFYPSAEADTLIQERGWSIIHDGDQCRRVVPSPQPKRILELGVIELLLQQQVVTICAGGGGIPVVRLDDGGLEGVEAVIDKDLASSLLARELKADALLLLTDVEAVYSAWPADQARAIRRIAPKALGQFCFAPGSMGPKVEAACRFVEQSGTIAGIGRLQDAAAILAGEAGTLIDREASGIDYWSR
ncbi:carbamate kinase [Methylomarinum sp. Ch1-1]|uniref:Carbamate kinase n=1 Tax=Methylomarinum roseum TaxID=3067653 RepID=A0AAU7NQC9_9GAMM|nr:carbamate kinase [Methylomarinum sp. Ch1-1]MDP4520869.1 carbamate kinase [Methylomarinum sp. Ch1-1]